MTYSLAPIVCDRRRGRGGFSLILPDMAGIRWKLTPHRPVVSLDAHGVPIVEKNTSYYTINSVRDIAHSNLTP